MINIGIAVRDLAAASKTFQQLFGCTVIRPEFRIEGQGVEAMLLQHADLVLELLSPYEEACDVARFIHRRGEGVYRIAFGSEGTPDLLRRWEELGIRFWEVSGNPANRYFMVHPNDAHGVLFEMVTARATHKPGDARPPAES